MTTETRGWHYRKRDVTAFQAEYRENGDARIYNGLLLLKKNDLVGRPENQNWEVSLDFGSTHTRAYFRTAGDVPGEIKPLPFTTRSEPVTLCQPPNFIREFFLLRDAEGAGENVELPSLLARPEGGGGQQPAPLQGLEISKGQWLPSDGFAYLHNPFDPLAPLKKFSYDLKWGGRESARELRAFLSCLCVMVAAEAFKKGGGIAKVHTAFPSSFPMPLQERHRNAWDNVAQKYFLIQETERITEADALCRYLGAGRDRADISTSPMVALDVGGSTTDLAIWSGNALQAQESLKLAGRIVGRFLKSTEGPAVWDWISRWVDEYLPNSSLQEQISVARELGYDQLLQFNYLLRTMEGVGYLTQFANSVRTAKDTAPAKLRAVIAFLFSGLLFYAGRLTRVKMPMIIEAGQRPAIEIRICGKGGTLLRWLNAYEKLAAGMFKAGMEAPFAGDCRDVESSASSPPSFGGSIAVGVNTSEAKQEVGIGLLRKAELTGLARPEGEQENEPYPVTVSEPGYFTEAPGTSQEKELPAGGELTVDLAKKIGRVPPLEELEGLTAFLSSFGTNDLTRPFADRLKLDQVNMQKFGSKLKAQFLNSIEGGVVYEARHNSDRFTLEPLFITEFKVLAGMLTPPLDLFG